MLSWPGRPRLISRTRPLAVPLCRQVFVRPVRSAASTARDATEDKVRGLSLGGDDYMTKPFSIEELVARIRSILRTV